MKRLNFIFLACIGFLACLSSGVHACERTVHGSGIHGLEIQPGGAQPNVYAFFDGTLCHSFFDVKEAVVWYEAYLKIDGEEIFSHSGGIEMCPDMTFVFINWTYPLKPGFHSISFFMRCYAVDGQSSLTFGCDPFEFDHDWEGFVGG